MDSLLWFFEPEGIAYLIRTFGLVGICLIIFAETGFFALLPGDSLLVLCGVFAATPDPATGEPLLSLWALLIVVPLCAITGDQVGYRVGHWAGNAIYSWRDFSVLGLPVYKKVYLRKTEELYERWGAFAIVAGRWVPIVRTFAPIVAGVIRMPWRKFMFYNVIGGFTWVWSMVLAGYFMDAVLRRIWPGFDLAENIDKIALVIIFLSLLPIIHAVWKERRLSREAAARQAAAAGEAEQ